MLLAEARLRIAAGLAISVAATIDNIVPVTMRIVFRISGIGIAPMPVIFEAMGASLYAVGSANVGPGVWAAGHSSIDTVNVARTGVPSYLNSSKI